MPDGTANFVFSNEGNESAQFVTPNYCKRLYKKLNVTTHEALVSKLMECQEFLDVTPTEAELKETEGILSAFSQSQGEQAVKMYKGKFAEQALALVPMAKKIVDRKQSELLKNTANQAQKSATELRDSTAVKNTLKTIELCSYVITSLTESKTQPNPQQAAGKE